MSRILTETALVAVDSVKLGTVRVAVTVCVEVRELSLALAVLDSVDVDRVGSETAVLGLRQAPLLSCVDHGSALVFFYAVHTVVAQDVTLGLAGQVCCAH